MSRRITADLVKKLKPGAAQRIIFDSQVPGFGARITPAGAISFTLDYWIHGRQRRYTIGRYPEESPESARNKALDLRRAISEGKDPLERRVLDRAVPNVADLAREYMERHSLPYKRPSSIQADKEMIEGIIGPKIGRLRVDSIGHRDIQDLHLQLKATPYRANRVLALLSSMFAHAILWGKEDARYESTTENPVHGIKKFPEEKRERWLDDAELKRLRDALDQHPDENAADAIRLILVTGARKGEVLSATRDRFDLDRAVWTKPSHHTKQKKTEHVPLSADALAIVKRAIAYSEKAEAGCRFLFPGKPEGRQRDGGKIEHPLLNLKNDWHDIVKAADLAGVRIHDLRHSYASHLVSNGASLPIVGRLLGHTQPQTTARYAHFADDPLRQATEQFSEIYRSAGKAKPAKPTKPARTRVSSRREVLTKATD